MGRIVHGSDYHNEHLDPPLRGWTERFRGGQTVRPLWSQIVTYVTFVGRIITVLDGVGRSVSVLKGLSHEIEMNYKWYKATEPY
jgi:hypothetical protein